jgi:excisionase family DNA binding protein
MPARTPGHIAPDAVEDPGALIPHWAASRAAAPNHPLQPPVPKDARSEVLTLPETACFLRVSPKTVQRLISGGKLKAFTVGRAIRIRRAELERFIGENSLFEG